MVTAPLRRPPPLPKHGRGDKVSGLVVRHIQYDEDGKIRKEEMLQARLTEEGQRQIVGHDQLANASRLHVIRDAGMGDCLLITAALRQIKREHPHLAIHFSIPPPYACLFEETPYITATHNVFGSEIAEVAAPGEAVVNVSLNNYCETHPMRHRLDRTTVLGLAFGLLIEDGSLDYFYKPGEREAAWDELIQRGFDPERPTLALVMRGLYPYRSWPPQQCLELLSSCVSSGYNVVCLDQASATTEGIAGPLPFYCYGRDLRFVASVLSWCDCVVTPDTGILHLAAAVQDSKPFLIALFSTIEPNLRMRWYRNKMPLSRFKDMSCVPCGEDGAQNSCNRECVKISSHEVWGWVETICAGPPQMMTRHEDDTTEADGAGQNRA